MEPEIEIGQPEGQTPFTERAEEFYEQHREKRDELSASEFWVVVEGYLREWVCMPQCNVYIQHASDSELEEAIEIYRHDVCEPNLTEMKELLDEGGYEVPKQYNAESAAKSVDELEDIQTDTISDDQIALGMKFSAQGFMNRWNMGAAASKRTDVRDAFVRNWHRANRWHVAFHGLAVEKGYQKPLPTIDAQG